MKDCIIELCDCTQTLLREIENPDFTQKQVARTYALAMLSSEPTCWPMVNEALLKRWPKGLLRVKKMAWKFKRGI